MKGLLREEEIDSAAGEVVNVWEECEYLSVIVREESVEEVSLLYSVQTKGLFARIPVFHLAFFVMMQAEQSSESLKRACPAL